MTYVSRPVVMLRDVSSSLLKVSLAPQVDIMQMCVVEMSGRPGKPLFHLEHYIEGKYIKYNSNSGFVRDDNIRLTPQVSRCLRLHVHLHVHLPTVLTSAVCPSGLQPLHLRAVGPPADRGGHPGGGGPVHRPADPHGEGDRLWRWKPGYGSALRMEGGAGREA